jgi:uncharacterized Zn finger protein (UPF0148 family)
VSRTPLAVSTFAVSAAFLAVAALFSPAAVACVSCNYTPEVVNTPVPGAKAKKVAKPERKAPPAKKHIAKKTPATRPADSAKADDASKDVATGSDAASAELETAAAPPGSATAALARQGTAEPKPEAEVGCKKFSATAGTTVTVPCE